MNDVVTPSQVISGLDELGVRPTCHVMIHASLSRFGHIEGGAGTLIDALRQAVGEEGAVIAPSFRDAIRSDHYALRECESACPQMLCPSRERGYTGIVGETVREALDSVRSCHPTHSWVGIGAGAEYLLAGHYESPTPCGHGSPFFHLMERDGIVLLLGVGVNSLTNFHAVEDVRNVPYLSAIDPPHRHATYTTSGRRIQYHYPEYLHDALARADIIYSTQIGAATCHALRARDLGSFLWLVTEDDPWCLVLRPTRDAYDPAADAARKTNRMAEVWNAKGDRQAWQDLLAASQLKPSPVLFAPASEPATACPAYRGLVRDHHRCAANDLPPWEKFEDYPRDEPGVATCQHCNWPTS